MSESNQLTKSEKGQLARINETKKKAKYLGGGLLIGLLIGIAATFTLLTYNPPDEPEPEPQLDVAVLLADVKQISELATASETYTVVEKVEKKNDKVFFDLIDVPFTDNFFILAYEGTIKAGVNMDEVQISLDGKTVHVTMPQAAILSDAIDTSSMKVLHEQAGMFSEIHVEDVAQYLDKSRQEAEAAAVSGTVLQKAQENAEMSIKAILEAALPEGYTIEFENTVAPQEG